MLDEVSLVRSAKEGDQAAFARLYEENFNRVYRYVSLRIGDRTEAEDLTQQVFLNALRAIGSFNWKGTPFTAWLFRIAHNQVVDHFRKKSRQSPAEVDDSLPSQTGSPEKIIELNFEVARMIEATKQLTPAQREVISLRFAGELSIEEVARIVGRSEGAVKALQHSAIIALRKVLMVNKDGQV